MHQTDRSCAPIRVLTMGNWHVSSFGGSWKGWIAHNVSAAFQPAAIQTNQEPLAAASALVRGQCWAAPCATQLHKSLLFSNKAMGLFAKIKKTPSRQCLLPLSLLLFPTEKHDPLVCDNGSASSQLKIASWKSNPDKSNEKIRLFF